MALYSVKLVAVKEFFVEAQSQKAALENEAAVEEQSFGGVIDWEFVEGEANEVSYHYAKLIRENKPEEILG